MGELRTVAELMAISARTAPKSAGHDFIVTKIIEGEGCVKLGDEMIAYGVRSGKRNFDRDGENVKKSPAVLLVGLLDASALGLNCGACGSSKCIRSASRSILPKENSRDHSALSACWTWGLPWGQP